MQAFPYPSKKMVTGVLLLFDRRSLGICSTYFPDLIVSNFDCEVPLLDDSKDWLYLRLRCSNRTCGSAGTCANDSCRHAIFPRHTGRCAIVCHRGAHSLLRRVWLFWPCHGFQRGFGGSQRFFPVGGRLSAADEQCCRCGTRGR
jgi:hypothetical protein